MTDPLPVVKIFSAEQLALTIFHIVLWALVLVGFWQEKGQDTLGLSQTLVLAGVALYLVWYLPFGTGFIGHSLYTLGTIPFLSILAAKGLAGLSRALQS